MLERLREAYDGPLNVHGSTTDESFDEVLIRFGARLLPIDQAVEFLKIFITTPFEGGRHADRVAKLGKKTY